MKGLILSLVASVAIGTVAAEELKIEVTLPVECDRKSKTGDNIQVHYRGTLAADGSQFDASYDRGSPLPFKLGAGRVIKGWDEGLVDMCIGEKRLLTIPPEYGYGQRNMGPIPAGSTLIFETELMGIDGVAKPEKIVTKATESASKAAETASEVVEKAETKIIDKVASAASEAAEVIGTIVADSDDGQEHNEL